MLVTVSVTHTCLSVGVINYMFSLWYMTEVCLRIYIYGIKDFFTRKPVQGICTFSVSRVVMYIEIDDN